MMADEFKFDSAEAEHTAQYLLPAVLRILAGEGEFAKTSIFDLGSGNGAMAELLRRHAYEVVGVDPSTSGIREAHRVYPYHGYLKNVGMALSGKLDGHFTALGDEGHIKFWSIPTLKQLLMEAGFGGISFQRIGRIPVFAKSMIALARRPQNT
jgi:SAM-dependent methyltransferase